MRIVLLMFVLFFVSKLHADENFTRAVSSGGGFIELEYEHTPSVGPIDFDQDPPKMVVSKKKELHTLYLSLNAIDWISAGDKKRSQCVFQYSKEGKLKIGKILNQSCEEVVSIIREAK